MPSIPIDTLDDISIQDDIFPEIELKPYGTNTISA